jgi:hypothetical protein
MSFPNADKRDNVLCHDHELRLFQQLEFVANVPLIDEAGLVGEAGVAYDRGLEWLADSKAAEQWSAAGEARGPQPCCVCDATQDSWKKCPGLADQLGTQRTDG